MSTAPAALDVARRAGDGSPQLHVVSERKLRVCLLGYRSKPHCGGQGIYLHYLSKALVELGHSVDVLSGPPYPELDPRVRLIRLPSLDMYAHERRFSAIFDRRLLKPLELYEYLSVLSGGFPEPYTFGVRAYRYLRAHRDEYDVIHDNQTLCYSLLSMQPRLGLPVVATVHHPITIDRDIAIRAAKTRTLKFFTRRWYSFLRMQEKVVRRLEHVVTVSDQARRDIERDFGRPASTMDVIHNGIDTTLFRPLTDVRREPGRLVATASAEAPLKGLNFLLKAMARLVREREDVSLVVVGTLAAGSRTARLLRRLKLGERVRFVSGLSNDELVREYNRAEVAVVPSLYEGFGLPAGEAMACGTPVVSTTGGALPEVVGDAGVLVAPGDDRALAAAIGELLDDPARRQALGKAGRERIEQCFDWLRVAEGVVATYYKAMPHADG